MSEFTIDVAKDFHPKPFGRYRSEGGEASAEVFREEQLIPAIRKYDHVVVDLSGYNYFGSSFLEETFAGLLRAGFSVAELSEKVRVIHNQLSSIELEAREYMQGITVAEMLRM